MTDETAQDLEQVWMAGKKYVPELSAKYHHLNKYYGDLGSAAQPAFQTGTGASPIHAHWEALRAEMEGLLGRTANNLDACGQTLMHVVNAFRADDVNLDTELKDNAGDIKNVYDKTPEGERFDYKPPQAGEGRKPTVPQVTIPQVPK